MTNAASLCRALLLLGIGIHLQVFAQNATLAAADSIHPSPTLTRPAEPPPGRLFFSPERRAALDRQRKNSQFQETVVEGESLTLNGIVTRSSGKWTMWVNGSALTEKDAGTLAAAPLAGSAGRGRLSDGGGAESRTLAVGEGIERGSGATSSLLGNGSIRVHSRAATR